MAVGTTARILVVSHEARRTGAPRVAVEIPGSLRTLPEGPVRPAGSVARAVERALTPQDQAVAPT